MILIPLTLLLTLCLALYLESRPDVCHRVKALAQAREKRAYLKFCRMCAAKEGL